MTQWQGRTAVVTGGGSGIGRAAALALAQRGVDVFVGDLRCPAEAEAEFAAAGVVWRECDVRREQDVARLIEQAVTPGGRIDLLVNNAGVGLVKSIVDVTADEWNAVFDVNLRGAFFGCKHAIPYMRQGGGGSIVNVASNAGLLPRAHDPVYSSSKGALVAFTKSLALCHSVDRIRVNAVCPGPVERTGMMNADLDAAEDRGATAASFIAAAPLCRAEGRMVTPEEVAEAICYLASDEATMITGTCLAIDGGKSLGVPPRVE